jgi:hypothetical protein
LVGFSVHFILFCFCFEIVLFNFCFQYSCLVCRFLYSL